MRVRLAKATVVEVAARAAQQSRVACSMYTCNGASTSCLRAAGCRAFAKGSWPGARVPPCQYMAGCQDVVVILAMPSIDHHYAAMRQTPPEFTQVS